jgi:DNA-directed RNA polymerase subunit RPC12/RpoP
MIVGIGFSIGIFTSEEKKKMPEFKKIWKCGRCGQEYEDRPEEDCPKCHNPWFFVSRYIVIESSKPDTNESALKE